MIRFDSGSETDKPGKTNEDVSQYVHAYYKLSGMQIATFWAFGVGFGVMVSIFAFGIYCSLH